MASVSVFYSPFFLLVSCFPVNILVTETTCTVRVLLMAQSSEQERVVLSSPMYNSCSHCSFGWPWMLSVWTRWPSRIESIVFTQTLYDRNARTMSTWPSWPSKPSAMMVSTPLNHSFIHLMIVCIHHHLHDRNGSVHQGRCQGKMNKEDLQHYIY